MLILECIKCGDDIHEIYGDDDSYENIPVKIWDKGSIVTDVVSYGSVFDMDKIGIPICDKCLSLLIKDGKVFYETNLHDKHIEKSCKLQLISNSIKKSRKLKIEKIKKDNE